MKTAREIEKLEMSAQRGDAIALYLEIEEREAERRWAFLQAQRFGGFVLKNLALHLDESAVENARCAARWAFEARPELCPGWMRPLERLQRARPARLGILARLRRLGSSWGLLRSVRGIVRGGGR